LFECVRSTFENLVVTYWLDSRCRKLTTVHLYINGIGDEPTSWSSNGIRNCGSTTTTTGSDATTVVQFTYNVETNSSTPGFVEQTIERRLKNLIVNSVADGLCSSSRRNLRMSERMLALAQVDGVKPDQSTGTCYPSVATSKSCDSYAGTLDVAYTNQGADSTEVEVNADVLKTVKTGMDTGVYKKKLNQGLQGTGVAVTNVKFTSTTPTAAPYAAPVAAPVAPPIAAPAPAPVVSPVAKPVYYPPVSPPVYHVTPETLAPTVANKAYSASSESNSYSTSGNRGLSRTGKVIVSVVALLLLLLLLLCCWARRVMIMRRNRRLGATHESSPKTIAKRDDVSTAGQISEDGESYTSTDFHDLGRYHSKLDVHKCTSATCRACNPALAIGKPPTLAQIAEGMATAPSSPDDDDSLFAPPPPPPPRRGRTSRRNQHPITFLRVSSPQRKSRRSNNESS
jgi:hypothetical protein